MADQQGLTVGTLVTGIVDGESVRVVAVRQAGDSALVSYERAGERGSAFLTRDQLSRVALEHPAATWSASWSDVRLGLQALAVTAAPHEGRLLAVSSSNVTPLPHQVQAVYHEMLPHRQLRFLLADDPGAGKTIMTGLYLKEVLARHRASRVLIVAPGSLSEQWVEEMWSRFGLRFHELGMEHLDRADPARPTVAPAGPLVVARLDQLSRNTEMRDAVLATGFDIVVVDEAHKMSARDWGSRTIFSKRYLLGQELAAATEHLLLLTATPHNGKPADFQHFMRLLGVELDPGTSVLEQAPVRRLVKEQLVHADGRPLFPPRVASTLTYAMTGVEKVLYEAVTDYVADEMNKVMDDTVRRHVGFAMMVLQRRLASSPEAILRSLERRLDLLRNQLELAREAEADLERLLAASLSRVRKGADDDDEDDITDDTISDATSARTPPELHTEILVLQRLVEHARRVRTQGVDRKWDALTGLLSSPDMTDERGFRRKIIVFTEHRDTLDYLQERLGEILLPGEKVAVISGRTARHERRQAQHDFRHNPSCSVLLATDAAGEGVNLQVANFMVNYDIPWNPNRLEQRFGRIHRIGQDRTCYLWNLVASDTREGAVFETLLGKLQVQRDALGDRVFDVLGDVLSGADLSQILTQAVRGSSGSGLALLEERLGRDLAAEVARREASTTEFTPEDLELIQRQLLWARKFDPQVGTVPDFALRALRRYGAEVLEVGEAVWSVPYVPAVLANEAGVERHYRRLHLDRAGLDEEAGASQLLAPGHPLLTALTRTVLHDLRETLCDGILLEDPSSASDYLLVTSVEDGYPRTWRYDVGGGRVEVAVAAASDLLPEAEVETSWTTGLVQELQAVDESTVAVAAVRGTGDAAALRARERQVEETAARLAAQGMVVRGRQGDGFDLAVESGPHVEFVTVASAVPS